MDWKTWAQTLPQQLADSESSPELLALWKEFEELSGVKWPPRNHNQWDIVLHKAGYDRVFIDQFLSGELRLEGYGEIQPSYYTACSPSYNEGQIGPFPAGIVWEPLPIDSAVESIAGSYPGLPRFFSGLMRGLRERCGPVVPLQTAEPKKAINRASRGDIGRGTLAAIGHKVANPQATARACAETAGIAESTLSKQRDWQDWSSKIERATHSKMPDIRAEWDTRTREFGAVERGDDDDA